MNLSQQLAIERRHRLEAERLLKLRESELRTANAKLARHSMSLSEELDETRAESDAARTKAQALETSFSKAQTDLARATEAADEAERRLWTALQTVRDGFALFDSDRRLVIANKAYLSIFDGLEEVRPGCPYEKVARFLVEEGIVDPEGPADAWLTRAMARLDQDPIPDLTIRLWNGQFVKLSDRRTPDGGLVAVGINQTEMMRIWAAIEHLPNGFVLFDQDDRLIMCNQRYREIYAGNAPVLIPGARFEDILHHGLALGQIADAIGREDAWLEERLSAHRSLRGSSFEQRLSDGRWLRVVDAPTPDGGRVGLRVDITTLKEHQAELERERERAEAANRAKSAFLANMSHEIRTPMNGVVGMADLLRETRLDEDQKLFVNTIKTSGEALMVILNDILDYSKIEAGRITLHNAPFDLEACLHDIVVLMQPRAREKALDLIVDFDMFMPVEFDADSGRIKQIVTNLVGNAVKFTESGHVLIRVTGVADTADPDLFDVHIAVEDTGIGIAGDKLDHVFGKFNQVEEDRNRSFEGTGLGLAITSELVEVMGGKIWVDSELGQGSCFGISLPLRVAAHAVRDLPTDPPAGLDRALVVEEASAARAILLKQLAALGFDTLTLDPVAPPEPGRFGPSDVAFVADSQDSAFTEAWVQALLGDGVDRVFLVCRTKARGTVSPGHPGVEAALSHPIRRNELSRLLHRIDPKPARAEGDGPTSPRAVRSRLRVLAAEDNRTNRLVFERLIADQDVQLVFACNGSEAVDLFVGADSPPDVIFMDISMPVMDGKEATRQIRDVEASRGLPPTPIVAMTAHALTGDAEEILAAGLDDYLTKPMRKDQVVERLTAIRTGQFFRRQTPPQAQAAE